jgi:hypothetical protein
LRAGIRKLHAALTAAGIAHVYQESEGTDHEWQTWRRNLHDFAPRLFRWRQVDTALGRGLEQRRDEQVGAEQVLILDQPRRRVVGNSKNSVRVIGWPSDDDWRACA